MTSYYWCLILYFFFLTSYCRGNVTCRLNRNCSWHLNPDWFILLVFYVFCLECLPLNFYFLSVSTLPFKPWKTPSLKLSSTYKIKDLESQLSGHYLKSIQILISSSQYIFFFEGKYFYKLCSQGLGECHLISHWCSSLIVLWQISVTFL